MNAVKKERKCYWCNRDPGPEGSLLEPPHGMEPFNSNSSLAIANTANFNTIIDSVLASLEKTLPDIFFNPLRVINFKFQINQREENISVFQI